MSFGGYLIRIKGIQGGTSIQQLDYDIPLSYIQEKTYKGTYSVLDGDSKRNGTGKLVRTVMSHKVPHCSVDMRSLNNDQVDIMMLMIRSRYTKPREKKLKVSMWVPELGDYVEAECYLPDIEFVIRQVTDTTVFYEPFTLEFIGY